MAYRDNGKSIYCNGCNRGPLQVVYMCDKDPWDGENDKHYCLHCFAQHDCSKYHGEDCMTTMALGHIFKHEEKS